MEAPTEGTVNPYFKPNAALASANNHQDVVVTRQNIEKQQAAQDIQAAQQRQEQFQAIQNSAQLAQQGVGQVPNGGLNPTVGQQVDGLGSIQGFQI